MRRLCLMLLLALVSPAANATWSIAVLESETGRIGVAGASCSYMVWGIQAVAPGTGVIITQAMSDATARSRGLEMIQEEAMPEAVLATVTDTESFADVALQQHAIQIFGHSEPAQFTGSGNSGYAGHLAAPGIAVQGNTLVSADVLETTLRAFRDSANKPLALRLLAALVAGGEAGGDKRCGEQRATSAFVAVYEADDPGDRPETVVLVYGREPGGENAVERLETELTAAWPERVPGERLRVLIEP